MNEGQSAVPNLLGMARTAIEARNDEEAISYFNRVLEIDPTVSEAWLGKGRSVARLSSLKHIRLHETAVAFGHAIGTAPENVRSSMAETAISELVMFATELHKANRLHWAKFVEVDGTSAHCVRNAFTILDVLDAGLRWCPHFGPALQLIMMVSGSALAYGVSDDQAAALERRCDEARAKLRATDPSFAAAEAAATVEAERQAAASAEAATRQIAETQAAAERARRVTLKHWALLIIFVVGLAILARF